MMGGELQEVFVGLKETVRGLVSAARNDVWFWWQNLSKADGEGELPLHGRATVTLRDTASLRFSWNLRSRFAHAYVDIDRDADITISVAMPPVAVWISMESWRWLGPLTKRTGNRKVSLSAHDGHVWWQVWADPHRWSEWTPRWRDGNFSVVDFLLGKERVQRTPVGEPVKVVVPMPEASYSGTCSIERVSRQRPRWFTYATHIANVKMDQPVPVPGKGENSWDCDEDAIYSMSTEARTPAAAVGAFVSSALESRFRYGGMNWRPEKASEAA
jgi:hypothetical protein